MKLMFNKKGYTGRWFFDNESDDNYTEKVPQNTNFIWDEELNDWALKPVESVIKED